MTMVMVIGTMMIMVISAVGNPDYLTIGARNSKFRLVRLSEGLIEPS